MAIIAPKKIRGKIYYYFQHSRRVKVNPKSTGKCRGSGKSKVVTETIYLGTAEQILKKCKQEPNKPVKAIVRSFGLEAAVLETARRIGIIDVLREKMPGTRFGAERWLFLLVCIINRISEATGKTKLGQWAKHTELPQLLGFDPKILTSKNYWCVSDDLISESDLQKKRKKGMVSDKDPLAGIDDQALREIEDEIFQRLQQHQNLNPELLFYDTANFFTFFEPPLRSELASPGNNKKSRHSLKQIGLAMAILKDCGIPMMHQIYRGKCHDSRVFPEMLSEVVKRLALSSKAVKNIVLVLDKGNNSEKNFAELAEAKLHFVGSLIPTDYDDLLDIKREDFDEQNRGTLLYSTKRKVFGDDRLLVLAYNEKLARKQEAAMSGKIAKAKAVAAGENEKRKRPATQVAKTFKNSLPKGRYGKCFFAEVIDGKFIIRENQKEIDRQRRRYGKNLLFTDKLDASSHWVHETYRNKDAIEKDFQIFNDPDLIRFQPLRHFTDTKIRTFAFCCVMALTIIKVMQKMVSDHGLAMSAFVLKQELADIKATHLIYPDAETGIFFTERSSVQNHLWRIFGLEKSANDLTLQESR